MAKCKIINHEGSKGRTKDKLPPCRLHERSNRIIFIVFLESGLIVNPLKLKSAAVLQLTA